MIPKLTCLIGIVLIDMVRILPNYTGLAGVETRDQKVILTTQTGSLK